MGRGLVFEAGPNRDLGFRVPKTWFWAYAGSQHPLFGNPHTWDTFLPFLSYTQEISLFATIPPYGGSQTAAWEPQDTATGNLLSARIGGNHSRKRRFSRSCSLTRLQPLQKKRDLANIRWSDDGSDENERL